MDFYSIIKTVLTSVASFTLQMTLPNLIWFVFMAIIFMMLWDIQKTKKLDLSDIITKNGKSVSLTKILQLVGGITATWVIVTLTMNSHLTESLFGLYLAYIGGVEGYSKFVAAKYNYSEKSIKEAVAEQVPTLVAEPLEPEEK